MLTSVTMNAGLRRSLARERTQYEHLASHDLLTDLVNRRGFLHQLARRTASSPSASTPQNQQ